MQTFTWKTLTETINLIIDLGCFLIGMPFHIVNINFIILPTLEDIFLRNDRYWSVPRGLDSIALPFTVIKTGQNDTVLLVPLKAYIKLLLSHWSLLVMRIKLWLI